MRSCAAQTLQDVRQPPGSLRGRLMHVARIRLTRQGMAQTPSEGALAGPFDAFLGHAKRLAAKGGGTLLEGLTKQRQVLPACQAYPSAGHRPRTPASSRLAATGQRHPRRFGGLTSQLPKPPCPARHLKLQHRIALAAPGAPSFRPRRRPAAAGTARIASPYCHTLLRACVDHAPPGHYSGLGRVAFENMHLKGTPDAGKATGKEHNNGVQHLGVIWPAARVRLFAAHTASGEEAGRGARVGRRGARVLGASRVGGRGDVACAGTNWVEVLPGPCRGHAARRARARAPRKRGRARWRSGRPRRARVRDAEGRGAQAAGAARRCRVRGVFSNVPWRAQRVG
jgi:hypothetical protein